MKNFVKIMKEAILLPPVPCYDWVKKDHIEKPTRLVQRGSAGWESGIDRAYESGRKNRILPDASGCRLQADRSGISGSV